jgi:patatin-like phospholipase/acyl hydrolase
MSRLSGPVRVLSIDGGGIRGYTPALVLADLERRRERLGRKDSLASRFDLIAGTSTGALIATAMQAPAGEPGPGRAIEELRGSGALLGRAAFDAPRRYRCADIAELYEQRGAELFPRPRHETLGLVRQALTSKYDVAPLERLLGQALGDLRLSQAAGPVLVTAYDPERDESLVMKNLGDGPDFLARDAARASSAAPTYYPAARIRELPAPGAPEPAAGQVRMRTLVDGGLFANNPAMCAWVEARKFRPDARRFLVVSLGTGGAIRSWNVAHLARWGYLDWIDPGKGSPLLSMMGRAQSESVDWMLSHLPGIDYVRLDPELAADACPMDDASAANLARLRAAALDLIAGNEALLEDLAARL